MIARTTCGAREMNYPAADPGRAEILRDELIRPLPVLLSAHAARAGDKVAFRDARRAVTYADLSRRTARLAGHLAVLGLEPGDRAAILLGNCVENIESYLAIARAAGVGVPLNPRSATAELAYMIEDSGARVIITDPAHLGQLESLHAAHPRLRVIVTGRRPSRLPGARPFDMLAGSDSGVAARDS